jgi:hypothetical protein
MYHGCKGMVSNIFNIFEIGSLSSGSLETSREPPQLVTNCLGNLRAFWELQHQKNRDLGTNFRNSEF